MLFSPAGMMIQSDLNHIFQRDRYTVYHQLEFRSLVGGLEHGFYDFPFHIWDVILPIDELTSCFFRGVGQPPIAGDRPQSRRDVCSFSHRCQECPVHRRWRRWRCTLLGILASGKRLHNYGKSQFFMGKSTINSHFQ